MRRHINKLKWLPLTFRRIVFSSCYISLFIILAGLMEYFFGIRLFGGVMSKYILISPGTAIFFSYFSLILITYMYKLEDISEHRNSGMEKENFVRFLSENPNPVLRIAKNGKILYVNDSAQYVLRSWNVSFDEGMCLISGNR